MIAAVPALPSIDPVSIVTNAQWIEFAGIAAIGLGSFRLNQVRHMIDQYPWRYERSGVFSWREKKGTGPA